MKFTIILIAIFAFLIVNMRDAIFSFCGLKTRLQDKQLLYQKYNLPINDKELIQTTDKKNNIIWYVAEFKTILYFYSKNYKHKLFYDKISNMIFFKGAKYIENFYCSKIGWNYAILTNGIIKKIYIDTMFGLDYTQPINEREVKDESSIDWNDGIRKSGQNIN